MVNNNSFKRFLLTCSLAALSTFSFGAPKLSIKAPNLVSLGQNFQISYAIDASPDSFNPPSFTDFKVIAGPVRSSGINIINGVKSENAAFTYYVQALKEGVLEVPQASVSVNGETIRSENYLIEVTKSGQNQPAQGGQGQQQPPQTQPANNEGELFLRTEISRSTLYKGESFVATIKLYARNTAVSGLTDFKSPPMTGFYSQEMNLAAGENNFKGENHNGKVYNVVTLKRYVLFPQRAGTIVIDPGEATLTIQVQRQRQPSRSLFDDFIGQPYETTEKTVKAGTVSVNVKDLPQGAPASFKGAVGNFKMTSAINKTETTANQALTYTLTIVGTGNLKLIDEPKIDFPPDFDKYDPKTTDNISTTLSGSTGNKKFEYTVIPRSAGEFEIPPVEFTYFDPSKSSYTTLSSEPVKLKIDKDPNGVSQPVTTATTVTGQSIRHLGSDILFIKTELPVLHPIGYVFFGSIEFWAVFAAIIIVFAGLFFALRKLVKDRSNISLMRNKKANKTALKRLKTAAKLMDEGNDKGFYEEVSRAIWGYLGDKLNMGAAHLSRDNVAEKLSGKGFTEDNVNLLLKVIDDCEFARYAPGGGGKKNIYNDAVEAISKLESFV